MQLDPSASTPVDSGLTYTKGSTAGTAISIQSAVDAVSGLRDSVASTSAENGLTRVVTAPTGDVNTVASPGPDLFAANTTTAVAFTRTPTQVGSVTYAYLFSCFGADMQCLCQHTVAVVNQLVSVLTGPGHRIPWQLCKARRLPSPRNHW